MGIAEDTANRLAADVIRHIEATGDEDIITLIGKALGDSSQTLQEAFITSVRVQRAAIRADLLIAARAEELAARPAADPEPAAPEVASTPPQGTEAKIEDAADPEADFETETAGAGVAEHADPEPNRAAQRARELLERRKAERLAAEEAERKAEAEASARRGRRAVPQVKTDPRLG